MVDDFDKRSEAVGGARGVADDVLRVVVKFGVDTYDVCGDVTFPRRGDENFLGSGFNMLTSPLSVHKHSCAFNNQINPQFPVRTNSCMHVSQMITLLFL